MCMIVLNTYVQCKMDYRSYRPLRISIESGKRNEHHGTPLEFLTNITEKECLHLIHLNAALFYSPHTAYQ